MGHWNCKYIAIQTRNTCILSIDKSSKSTTRYVWIILIVEMARKMFSYFTWQLLRTELAISNSVHYRFCYLDFYGPFIYNEFIYFPLYCLNKAHIDNCAILYLHLFLYKTWEHLIFPILLFLSHNMQVVRKQML